MKKTEIKKIYDIVSCHVRIYRDGKLMEVGTIDKWAFVRIMNILERELKLKKHKRQFIK